MLEVTIRGVGTPKGFISGERTAAQWVAGEVRVSVRLVCGRIAEDLPVGAVLEYQKYLLPTEALSTKTISPAALCDPVSCYRTGEGPYTPHFHAIEE